MKFAVIFVAIVCFSGCTSTGVVSSGDDTYMIAKKSAQVGFGPPVKTEAAVYQEAGDDCASQGKIVQTVDKVVRNSTFGRPGSVNLKYRCVETAVAEEPAPTPESLSNGRTADVEGTAGASVDGNSPDLYSELIKLDDLRQRGLITGEEYEQEKKELLEKY